ncbi:MAG: phosphoribosyl-ATP diphosphatase [Alphaproteobacteria bacterium]|nr:phosphoribosyl-ATP diphosphatase [Alphaproteobacteria bacterium]MCB9975101.1 phosphoribosyl-ATP diphosphatase [Rhodospirillales bacterium]
MSQDILKELYRILQERKKAEPDKSYVSSLYNKGIEKMIEKLAEETKETVDEARKLSGNAQDQSTRTALIGEATDLTFHLLVLLAHYDIPPEEILIELERRFGTGGHEEKAARNNKQ